MVSSSIQQALHEDFKRRADRCSSALMDVSRLVAAAMYGPLLIELLARACVLLDELDEVLIGLHPGRDHEAFARAAALHRTLEEIQSHLPPEWRRQRPR